MNNKHLRTGWLILLGLLLSGCGYKIAGQSRFWPKGVRKVYVETIRNRTTEPGLDKRLTDALIQELWRWPQVQVVKRSEADAVLAGAITGYVSNWPLSFDRDRHVREYELTLQANLHLEKGGKTVWQKKDIKASEDYHFFENDLARTRSQEHLAQQKAAKDLAIKLLDMEF